MITKTNKAQATAAATKAKKEDGLRVSPKKKTDRTELENLSRSQKPKITTQEFQSVNLKDKDITDDVKNILEQYQIGTTEWDKAVIGDKAHGEQLIVVCRGESALGNLFGGKTGVGRGLYKLFGWGRFFGGQDKTVAAKKYAELFNASHEESPKGIAGEPLSHLMNGLKSNHYHTIMTFDKDPKTGKYQTTPQAIGVLDSYELLIEPFLEYHKAEGGKVLEPAQAEYRGCFAFDKLIPMHEGIKDLSGLYDSMAESLSQMQDYKLLTLPTAVHKEASIDSDAHNYSQLKLLVPAQANDGSWKVLGDKACLKDEWFKSDAERKAFEARFEDTETGITMVRPLADKGKGLLPSLGWTLVTSQIFAGPEARVTDDKEKSVIDTVARINAELIQAYNKEHNLATPKDPLFELMIKDSNEGKHLEAGADGSKPWYKRMFSWGAEKPVAQSDAKEEITEEPDVDTTDNEVNNEATDEIVNEEDADATITAASEDEEAPKASSHKSKTTSAA